MRKKLIASAVLASSLTFAQAIASKNDSQRTAVVQTSNQLITLLPSKEEVDSALRRTLGYDLSLNWAILDIHPALVSGLVDVVVSINKQAPQHIYYSPATQSAIIGELIPFGPNPFVATREKLRAADGPSRGAQKPVIEIVEFSDLECPHCKVAQPVLEKLANDFPQVRYTFQQFPLPASLHPWAMKAALYADCAASMKPDSFWKFVDSVFENQGSIALATVDDKLKELATPAGLDPQKLAACAATPQAEARVQKSIALGETLEVTQTPTVFMNGRKVQGIANIPYDQLKMLVQFEIDHAGK
jgi:protein-disulfide isomerase